MKANVINIKTYEAYTLRKDPMFDGDGVQIYDLDGEPKHHIETNWLNYSETYDADMSRCYFRGEDLTGAIMSNCNLRGSDFQEVNFNGFDGTESDFSGCNMIRARLTEASFAQTNFSGVDLTGADLFACDFSNSNLSGVNGLHTCKNINTVNFTGCDLTGIDDKFFKQLALHATQKGGFFIHLITMIENRVVRNIKEVNLQEYLKDCKGVPGDIWALSTRISKTRSLFKR